MSMNAKGQELYDKWNAIYFKENNRLGGNSERGDFIEGWCIIENENFVKTPEDIIGLYLFGYDDDIFYMIEEWKKNGIKEKDNLWEGINFTLKDFEEEIENYFD